MTNSTLRKNSRRPKKIMNTELQPGPRTSSLQRILGYSRALRVVNAPPIGEICLIMN